VSLSNLSLSRQWVERVRQAGRKRRHCGEKRFPAPLIHSNTYVAGSRTPLLLWHLSDRFYPAVSVFEDVWIDLFHTYLADPMTKLSL
jgi:hypothetical protein